MERRHVFTLVAASAFVGVDFLHASPNGRQSSTRANAVWVEEVLRRMQTIRPGQTRRELLEVFPTEGGLSTSLQRTFVSQDCPYFKVDVTFRAIGRPDRDVDDRETMVEDARDVISTISRPYLAWTISD
jgi:hypothetical protein